MLWTRRTVCNRVRAEGSLGLENPQASDADDGEGDGYHANHHHDSVAKEG